MAKLIRNGEYGQLELNQVAFPRDGRIEAQCALATKEKFPEAAESTLFSADVPAENGMILVIDNVNRVVKKAGTAGGGADDVLFALNYTTEHMYDDRDLGSLRKFKLVPGTFYPRLGYLAVGDKFTTNAIELDDAETYEAGITVFKTVDLTTSALYFKPGTNGYWVPADSATDGKVVCQAIKKTTMPDGQPAFKLQVVKA